MKSLSVCATLVIVACLTFAQVQDGSAAVLDRDRALARDLLEDRNSIAKYRALDFVVGDNPVLRDYFSGSKFDSSARLTLHPNEAKVLAQRLAYSTGSYEYSYIYTRCNCAAREYGTYVSIWKQKKDGWKLAAFIPSDEGHYGCGCSG